MKLKYKNFLGEEDSIRRRLLKGYFWSIFGAVSSKALMVFVSYYIARSLGKAGYGELAILQNTINTLGVFAGLGVGAASTKYIAQYRNSNRKKTGKIVALNTVTVILMSTMISVAMYFLSNYLAEVFLNNEKLGVYLKIGSVALFFAALNGALNGALSGFEMFKIISVIGLVGSIVNGVLQITYVNYFGIKGVILAIVISQIVSFVVGMYYFYFAILSSGILLSLKGVSKEIRLLVKFNLPSILSSIMVAPVNWVCNIFLVNQEKGYEQMGIFGAANQWKMALLFIPMATWKVVLPLLSELLESKSSLSYKKVFFFNLYVNGIASLIVILLITAFSNQIMLWYGEEFSGGEWVLVVLVSVAGLMAVNGVVGQAIASQDRMWIGFLFNLLWGVEMLVLAYYLCPLYGALGLALANLIAYCVHTIVQFFYVRRFLFREANID